MRRWVRGALTGLLAAAAMRAGGGPDYVSHVWRTQEGLPENRIRALAQTPDGYLWIGTTGGLARFDGARFVTYSRVNTAALADDNIRALAVGADGALWVGTDGGGIVRIAGGRWERFGAAEGLESPFVAAVGEDARGRLWAGTNRGLYLREGARFRRMDRALGLAHAAFFTLLRRQDGELLAGGQPGILRAGDAVGSAGVAREGEEVFRMRETRGGRLWISANLGLRTMGAGEAPDVGPLKGKAIGALVEDRAGHVWVGTLGDGLYRYWKGRGAPERVEVTLPDRSVYAIHEDREGCLWIGTADGLVRLTEPDVRLVDHRDGLGNDHVSTVYCEAEGSVAMTTVTGELFRYDGARAERVRLPGEAAGLRLLGAYREPGGAWWYGTDNQGAVRIAGGAARRFTMREGLRNNGIQFFHQSRDGAVWIGTTSGLSRWDGARLRNYYTEDGLSYGWVRVMAEEPGGDLLVGTDRGLNRMRGGEFVADPALAALKDDKIWALYPEGPGTWWIGTRNAGLVRLREGRIRRLTTREGLVSDAIFQIVGAGDGRVWLSGPVGISSATLADLNAAADGRLDGGGALAYRIGSGLESVQSSGGVQPAGCVAASGEVWFPSVKGAVHFPSRRPPIRRHDPVRMERVLVDGEAAGTDVVRVAAGRRRVRFEFTSCTLRSPEGVRFRYRLAGYDPRWVAAEGARAVEYDNLPPGQYHFEVEARDESPGRNVSAAAVTVDVEPRFYQTVWFLPGLGVAAGLGVVAVFRRRERRAREAYDLRWQERTQIAREMHDTLVQGCVGVSTLIEAAAGSAGRDPARMMECLDTARMHLRLTIDEARQALGDLRYDSFDHGLSGAVRALAAGPMVEKGPALSVEISGEERALPEPVNRALLLVTREAVRNAVTHAGASMIEVTLHFGAEAVEIDIADDGRGFQPDPERLAAAGRFGILGMRERLEQLGGTLTVASGEGEGTVVSARLPVENKSAPPIPR